MVDTIKFSQMTDGGNIDNDKKTPGLKDGANVLFNNPWTFLPSGTTAQRPAPSAEINFRLRFNTDDQLYEYYDAVAGQWSQLQESSFTQGPFIIYEDDPNIPDGQNLGALGSGLLKQAVTLGSSTLSIAINGTDYWAPGDALTRTQAPVVGDDVTNKTYVDALVGSGVTSLQGTANQVLVNGTSGSPQMGALVLTLPQDIATSSNPTFAGLTLSSPLGSASGGTGVNNGSSTLTLGGSLSTLGAFTTAFTMTGNTAVTFPTSGTLATTSQLPSGAALTKVDDSNVTLTLGGTPATALLQAVSLTLGWTGQLPVPRGGSGLASATAYAVLCGGTTSTGAFQSVASVGSTGQVLTSNGPGALPTFQNVSGTGTVNSGLINQLAWYAANGTAVSGLTTANNSVLATNGSGIPGWVTTLPSGVVATGSMINRQVLKSGTTYTPTAGTKSIFGRMLGGGGGSCGTGTGSPGNGGTGGTTSFNSGAYTAPGGNGSLTNGSPGVAGSAGVVVNANTDFASRGSGGGYFSGTSVSGIGGSTFLGGGGSIGVNGGSTTPGLANSGGGAGGANPTGSVNGGSGAASGSYTEFWLTGITGTYSYVIGAGGTAGSVGTGGVAGQAGGSGIIIIDEYA